MGYNRITNPETNRKVNITSKLGKYILKKYLFLINGGNRLDPRDDPDNPCWRNPDNMLKREELCDGEDDINFEEIPRGEGFCNGPNCIARRNIIDFNDIQNNNFNDIQNNSIIDSQN